MQHFSSCKLGLWNFKNFPCSIKARGEAAQHVSPTIYAFENFFACLCFSEPLQLEQIASFESDNLFLLISTSKQLFSIVCHHIYTSLVLSFWYSLRRRSICFFFGRRYALASLVQAAYWITLINSCKWPLKLHQNKHGRQKKRIGMFGKQILLLISLCSVEVLTLVGKQHKNIPKWKKQVLVINYSINSFH